MRSFKQFVESKQVGTIYHYTHVDTLYDMLHSSPPFNMQSHNGETISATRNPNLHHVSDTFNSHGVRISLDGDKISNNHKVKPVAGLTENEGDVLNHKHNDNYRVKRSSGEAEEVILKHPFKMKDYIKHIHIIRHRDTDDLVNNHIIPKLKEHNIPYSHHKSFDVSENVTDYNDFFNRNQCFLIYFENLQMTSGSILG
jgi:hypothetical protein